MKIGIFGGTFDPIHTGHAMVANYAAQWLGLDEVWMMVSPQNPLKAGRKISPDAIRLEMAKLVAAGCSGVVASDFEFSLPKPSYTYNTLCRLKEAYPEHEFSLIIGGDNWELIDRWREYQNLVRDFEIWVYPRPGYSERLDLEGFGKDCKGVNLMTDCPQALISSTMIRESVKKGKNVNYMVPPEVYEYIKQKKLYLS